MLKIFQAAAADPDMVNLGEGEPDFDTEHDIIDAAAKAAKEGYTHYGPIMGFEDVRRSVCGYWDRRYGLKIIPDEVMIMAGGSPVGPPGPPGPPRPGREVITAEPCFTPYFEQIYQHRGTAVHLPTTEEPASSPRRRPWNGRSRRSRRCS
jgi:aspartate/methionine/tyrosine aminotransferase